MNESLLSFVFTDIFFAHFRYFLDFHWFLLLVFSSHGRPNAKSFCEDFFVEKKWDILSKSGMYLFKKKSGTKSSVLLVLFYFFLFFLALEEKKKIFLFLMDCIGYSFFFIFFIHHTCVRPNGRIRETFFKSGLLQNSFFFPSLSHQQVHFISSIFDAFFKITNIQSSSSLLLAILIPILAESMIPGKS